MLAMRRSALFLLFVLLVPLTSLADIRKSTGTTNNLGS
jgi:hypothetical protein